MSKNSKEIGEENTPLCLILYPRWQSDIREKRSLIMNKKGREATVNLRWLPTDYRIKFKIVVTVFKALLGEGPAYISDMLCQARSSTYNLGSNAQNLLLVSRTRCPSYSDSLCFSRSQTGTLYHLNPNVLVVWIVLNSGWKPIILKSIMQCKEYLHRVYHTWATLFDVFLYFFY